MLRWSWSTWVSGLRKAKGNPCQHGFCESGIRGEWYHLFWGRNRLVGVYHHSPLTETERVELRETADPCLLVRPIGQLGVGRQCPCPQQEVGQARGFAMWAVTPETQTRDVSCERHRSPLSEGEGVGTVPVEGFVGPY